MSLDAFFTILAQFPLLEISTFFFKVTERHTHSLNACFLWTLASRSLFLRLQACSIYNFYRLLPLLTPHERGKLFNYFSTYSIEFSLFHSSPVFNRVLLSYRIFEGTRVASIYGFVEFLGFDRLSNCYWLLKFRDKCKFCFCIRCDFNKHNVDENIINIFPSITKFGIKIYPSRPLNLFCNIEAREAALWITFA